MRARAASRRHPALWVASCAAACRSQSRAVRAKLPKLRRKNSRRARSATEGPSRRDAMRTRAASRRHTTPCSMRVASCSAASRSQASAVRAKLSRLRRKNSRRGRVATERPPRCPWPAQVRRCGSTESAEIKATFQQTTSRGVPTRQSHCSADRFAVAANRPLLEPCHSRDWPLACKEYACHSSWASVSSAAA